MEQEDRQKVAELLVDTKAYRDLEKPVILASGQLGIFYINTENILKDGGKFKKYQNESFHMADHVRRVLAQNEDYAWLVNKLADDVLAQNDQFAGEPTVISGGQTRDWLFSLAIAQQLDVDHLSLYKDPASRGPGLQVIQYADHKRKQGVMYPDIKGTEVWHQVDLITEGSSVYHEAEDGTTSGWVHQIRRHGGEVKHLGAVVDRLQGGERMLSGLGIKLHPIVEINDAFLDRYSSDPYRAKAYLRDPRQWSEEFLSIYGTEAFVDDFNPEGGRLVKAARFLERFEDVLAQSGHLVKLKHAVEDRYDADIFEITEGKA